MKEQHLRRLFRQIMLAAAPLPLALGAPACGGAVTDSGQRERDLASAGSAGVPVFTGKVEAGGAPAVMGRQGPGGSAPVYLDTGSAPGYAGSGGALGYAGSGGVPVYYGSVPAFPGTGGYAGEQGTGGVPVYYGAGGSGPVYGTAGAGGAVVYAVDAGLPPQLPPACAGQPYQPCGVHCVFLGSAEADSGALTPTECTSVCGSGTSCSVLTYAGQRYAQCQTLCLGGRRPDGLLGAAPSPASPLALYFESMCRLEAASIPAFRILRRELGLHGAPRKLRRSALSAARDEVRHARVTRELARRYGGRYVPPRIEARPARSIEALAIENAVEGCVRETFGAMMATWQAEAATDPAVRKAMKGIARDETRHAALALRVAKWAERRLDADARRRVAEAKRAAVATLVSELDYDAPSELASVAGVPSGAEARRMAAALDEQLWA